MGPTKIANVQGKKGADAYILGRYGVLSLHSNKTAPNVPFLKKIEKNIIFEEVLCKIDLFD